MDHDTLIIFICAVAMGLSIAVVAWTLSRSIAEIPEEDREYRDPPPLAFRFIWWPIQWISFYFENLMPEKARSSMAARLRKASLDYALTPAQFVAARILCAIILATVFHWIVGSFDPGKFGGEPIRKSLYLQAATFGALFGWFYPILWLRDRIQKIRRELLKSLPFYLDIITLCVEAGLNLQGAIGQAVAKGPKGLLREEFQRVLRDVRAGKPRAEAMRNMATRLNEAPITKFISSIVQAEYVGMNLGPVLRAQADQQRSERFLRAEKLAMEAPVKLLFPLIAFIFPCTFIVLAFLIVTKFMTET